MNKMVQGDKSSLFTLSQWCRLLLFQSWFYSFIYKSAAVRVHMEQKS